MILGAKDLNPHEHRSSDIVPTSYNHFDKNPITLS